MARNTKEPFASFEGVDAYTPTTATAPPAREAAGASANVNSQTTPPTTPDAETGSGFTFQFPSTPAEHGLPRGDPPPPLFNDHEPRPYGFNWSESTADGTAHPGSMPHNPSRDSGAHRHHHYHGGRGGCRGRSTPYGRSGPPPPHRHHHHHRPPPPFWAGPFPFGFGGPFGRSGPWIPCPPPPPFASTMEEDFSKAHQQRQQSRQSPFGRLNEMRDRMNGDFGNYGYQSSNRGRYQSYASGSGNRSKSAPAPKDVPKPRCVGVAKAWETYAWQWKKLTAIDAPQTINLSEVPWPVVVDTSKMKTLSEMTNAVTATTVGEFVLSPKHSPDVSNKKRIHQALRLYHPDRFETAVVAKLEEKDKEVVRGLGEVVAKCLNKLLEKEN